jgi:hypothetical protein
VPFVIHAFLEPLSTIARTDGGSGTDECPHPVIASKPMTHARRTS